MRGRQAAGIGTIAVGAAWHAQGTPRGAAERPAGDGRRRAAARSSVSAKRPAICAKQRKDEHHRLTSDSEAATHFGGFTTLTACSFDYHRCAAVSAESLEAAVMMVRWADGELQLHLRCRRVGFLREHCDAV